MLKRSILRDQVREKILEKVIIGDFQPGKKITLSNLAEELDVSTTPVREALTQLEHEGFLKVEPNRGFYMTPLNLKDASQLYPIIWTLEILAVETTENYNSDHLESLRTINNKFISSIENPVRAMKYDTIWHQTLVCKCGNELLLAKLEELKRRATLYEYYFMKDSGGIPQSVNTHKAIIDDLSSNKIHLAKKRIKGHWQNSLSFLSDWLKSESDY